MRSSFSVSIAVALLSCLAGLPLLHAEVPEECVAAITRLVGPTTVQDVVTKRPVQVGEVLTSGSVLHIEGSLSLVWMDGRRFEVAPAEGATSASIEVQTEGPHLLANALVKELEPVLAVARLEPLLRATAERRRAAAARIRAVAGEDQSAIHGLRPGAGEWIDAARVVLAFEPVEGAESYRVEIKDGEGNVVWSVETAAVSVSPPTELLQSDDAYFWSVSAQPRSVWRSGEALFFTADSSTLSTLRFLQVQGPEDLKSLATALLSDLESGS